MILVIFISYMVFLLYQSKGFFFSFQLQFYVKQRFQITEGHHKQKLLKCQKYALIFLLFLFAVSVILYLANGYSYCHLWKTFLSIRLMHKPQCMISLLYSLLEVFKLLVCEESKSFLLLPIYCHLHALYHKVSVPLKTQKSFIIWLSDCIYISKMNSFFCT